MKKSLLLAVMISWTSVQADDHAHPFNPIEEDRYFSPREKGVQSKGVFPYMYWNECQKNGLEGNYSGSSCNRKRRVSEILYEFMEVHLSDCIEDASHLLGHQLENFKIIHDGIFADSKHSPRSLHAEGRAIDIASIVLKTDHGESIDLAYAKHGKGRFYSSLRACWGIGLAQFNECPYYGASAKLTGSIGRENRRHQNHLHLSVPVCYKGSYSGRFFIR
jgi:hypothetical protein